MEKISVIVPIYNAAPFLHKCIESILGQTYQNLELILVDDCSADGSVEICSDYALKDTRVRVYQNDIRTGVSGARNLGISKSSGTYIMFVDADDWLALDAIEICLPYIPEYDLVRVSATAVFPDKDVLCCIGSADSQRRLMKRLISRRTILACWGTLFRKELIDRYSIFFDVSLDIAEDWQMMG